MKTMMLRFSLLLILMPTLALAHDWGESYAVPGEKFDDGARTFQSVKDTLLHEYYKGDVTEADLYRAAVRGMLAGVDPALSKYNHLLGPSEYGELNIEMSGQLQIHGASHRKWRTSRKCQLRGAAGCQFGLNTSTVTRKVGIRA